MIRLRRTPRPAFYALPAGGWRDYVTLLHPPYTLWHLSYVVLAAAAAPQVSVHRLALALAAFFLGVGVAAHAFDELNGRPLGTRIPSAILGALGVATAAGALAIGVYGAVAVSAWLWPFILFGLFILPAYNLELFGGRFHTDAWFAFAWGAFPFLATYWATAKKLDAGAVLLALACLTVSLAQRRLSTRVRTVRRRAVEVRGAIRYRTGEVEPIDAHSLTFAPEAALQLLSASVVLLSTGLLALRL